MGKSFVLFDAFFTLVEESNRIYQIHGRERKEGVLTYVKGHILTNGIAKQAEELILITQKMLVLPVLHDT